jgi:hypothetical protein
LFRQFGIWTAGIVAALALLVVSGPAEAAVYNVVPTPDGLDTGDGKCGLREAIDLANGLPLGDTANCGPSSIDADVINVAAGQYLVGSSLYVSAAVEIRGAGSGVTTIDAQGLDRVFQIAAGPVAIRDVTITGGRTPDAGSGGDAFPGGGIWSDAGASLTLERVIVTGNATGKGGGGAAGGSFGGSGGKGGDGGGIYARGPLTITDSSITSNVTGAGGAGGSGTNTGGGGGSGGIGGAVFTWADTNISGSTISSNSAGAGGPGGTAPTNGGTGGTGGSAGAIRAVGGSLTITGSVVSANHAGAGGNGGNGATSTGQGGLGGDGGGIDSFVALTLAGSVVSGNTAGDGGPGGGGGGVANGARGGFAGGIRHGGGQLTISDSTISDNRSGAGAVAIATGDGGQGGTAGGLLANSFGMPTTIVRSTIAGNATGAGGKGGTGGGTGGGGGLAGGIYGAFTALEIVDSTIAGNRTGNGGSARDTPGASGRGGGLAFESGQPLSVTNTTIAGNATGAGGDALLGLSAGAGSGPGAGAYLGSSQPMLFKNVTIAGNQTGDGGTGSSNGGRGNGGGLHAAAGGGTVTLTGTILGANGPANCSTVGGGMLADGGHNISFPESSCPGTVADPRLGALAANGGPTQTMALASGSAAIDIVPADSNCPAADQRGIARPIGAACDAGAFEFAPPPAGSGSPGAGPDTTAPIVRLFLTRQRLRRALRRGYFARFSTNETGSAVLQLSANSRLLASRRVRVARGTLAVAHTGRNRIVAKFTRKARRRLAKRRAVRLRLVLTVKDAAGNRTKKAARIRLRR